jgi:predicted Zn-dependent protease
VTRRLLIIVTLAAALAAGAPAQTQTVRVAPGDTDQTFRAMKDEMERSTARLRMGELERPFYIEYRVLDVELRAVSASFGALVNSSTTRNRIFSVEVRVGDYQFDSSNFMGDDGFQGFIGSTGQVGIDRDYESLRQDLWLATDQAYKEALARLSRKRAYVASLARKPDIADFSREQPVVLIESLPETHWGGRNWEEEVKAASAVFRGFPEVLNNRVTYYLMTTTYYLMNSEGTQIRTNRRVAAIEAGASTQSKDGMRLRNFYATAAREAKELPPVSRVREELQRVGRELMAQREATPAPDYTGPVLLEAPATAALLAQILPSSISGARPALSMSPFFEQMMQMAGRSEWLGRLNSRVLPAGVTLRVDPTAKEFQGQPLLGGYEVDEEGVRAKKVALVEDGTLKALLMSRRPGPDFSGSNGHGRSAMLADPRPAISNLIFESAQAVSPAELKKKFLEACKAEGREWCVLVRRLDNPVIGMQSQEDLMEMYVGMAGGGGAGDRMPLLMYKVYVADGREELLRGGNLTGLTLRNLRRIAAVGSDAQVYHYFQSAGGGVAGMGFSAFGNPQNGMPTSIVAPSLLLEEGEVRGARGEPRRLPLLPAPPLN